MKVAATFEESLNEFVEAAMWLGSEHQPALVTLFAIAKDLDAGSRTPALIGQFGLAYRSLQKLAPAAGGEGSDPLDDVLEEARA